MRHPTRCTVVRGQQMHAVIRQILATAETRKEELQYGRLGHRGDQTPRQEPDHGTMLDKKRVMRTLSMYVYGLRVIHPVITPPVITHSWDYA